MELPSKELLSEVLDTKAFLRNIIDEKTYEIHYFVDGVPIYNKINIHELAHKCKEWALKKHQLAISSGSEGFQSSWFEAKVYETRDYKLFQIRSESGLTEPEAIFKACEWVRTKLIKETA